MKIQTRHKNVFVGILLDFALILSWLVLLDKNETGGSGQQTDWSSIRHGAEGLLGYYSCSATQTTWRMSNGPRRVSLFSVPARKMDQKILKEMKNKLKSEWNIWEASAVTKDLRWRLSNSLNHARLVLIIPALPASNKTSSLVIFTIILMNLSNMQIIKTSIPDAELHKTQHDNFLCSHLTVIVTSDIWVSGRGCWWAWHDWAWQLRWWMSHIRNYQYKKSQSVSLMVLWSQDKTAGLSSSTTNRETNIDIVIIINSHSSHSQPLVSVPGSIFLFKHDKL